MVNSGTIFEYKVRDYLKAVGYFVIRAAGSKGAYDLVAWNATHALAIQCKKEKKKRGRYTPDLTQMDAVPVPANFTKQLWVKTNKDVRVYDEKGTLTAQMTIQQINKVIKNSN